MGSKREEERNEKIIRGLMKLPPNRRCINCNSLGPQYVCTTFWTFVCMACSGIHREFTHRVKSVSMSKFTSQEVEVLQTGGNQRAREIYLRHWDHQRQRFPDSSNADKVREFIKNVYVQKKYAGSNATDKPLKDCQNHGSSEDVTRRANSYHSYSQSPPYDYQYEERRYGKIPLGFSNKSASTRGLHAKASSFVYSPGRFSDHMFEDQFANEGSAPRASDFSASSGGDPFRSQTQSPNFQHEVGFRSPQIQHSKTPSNENIFPGRQHQRTTSFGSARSVDSNSIPIKSHSSNVLGEAISEHCQNSGSQQDKTSTPVDSLADLTKAPLDLFQLPGAPAAQYVNTFQPSTGTRSEAVNFHQPPQTYPSNQADLFAGVVGQQATARPPHMPVPKSEGWASFDNPVPAAIATNAITTAEPVNLHPPPQTYPSSQADLFAGIVGQQPTAIPPQMSVPRSEGWASFENHMPAAIATNAITTSGVAKLEVKSEGISQPSTSLNWPPYQSIVDQHALSISSPWQDDLPGIPNNVAGNPPWNAFADSIKTNPLDNANQTHQVIDGASTSSSNVDQQRLEAQVVEELSNDGTETARFPDSSSGFDFPGSIGIAPAYSPLMEEPWQHLNRQKSANPFDLPYDSEFDPNDMFVDMSSLQGELPDFHTEPAFLNGVSQPWLATDSVAPYLPASAGTQGGIACMAAVQTSTSQLQNAAAQGPVASTGGNPFA